ncbi:unnamed protein product [Closterium sp. Naga37s-1]|nr:unnamed protein product [Closterium sp. Naga37s-1]
MSQHLSSDYARASPISPLPLSAAFLLCQTFERAYRLGMARALFPSPRGRLGIQTSHAVPNTKAPSAVITLVYNPLRLRATSLLSSNQSSTTDPSARLSGAQPSLSPLPSAPLPCPCAICSRRALISASLLISASALPANGADSNASAQTAEAAQAALAAVRGGKWQWQEELFAWMMATGMKEYEESVEGYKLALFEPLRSEVGRVTTGGEGGEAVGGGGTVESGNDAVFRLVEIGVGAGSALARSNGFSSLKEAILSGAFGGTAGHRSAHLAATARPAAICTGRRVSSHAQPSDCHQAGGVGAVQAREVMGPGLSLLAPHVVGTAVKT